MSFQRIIIEGNTGQEPRVTDFQNGGSVAQFNIAVTERGFTRKDGTQVPEHTEWFSCRCSGSLVTVIRQYLHKGDRVLVEGKLKTRDYTDKNNQQQKITELHVDNLSLLSPKPQGQTPLPQGYQQSVPQQGYQMPLPQQGYQMPPQGYNPNYQQGFNPTPSNDNPPF